MSTARNEIDPDMDAHAAAVEGEVGYAWEARYKRSWDEVQEDANGVLSTSAWRLQEQLKRRK